jgi:protein-S-isoprenylcysteine O-methyltransferase Ste14
MARRVIPPVYLLLTITLMVTLHKLQPLATLWSAPWRYSGLLPLLAGLSIVVWSALLFARAQTPIKPFEETTQLVTGGMYRYTRNPMYLGMVFVLIGIAMMLGSLTPFLPIPVFAWLIHSLFITREEVLLEERFGDAYRDFRNRVRRWL